MGSYRPNVAVILRKPKSGKILVGMRADHKGSWQFPQGGVDSGEDLIAALYRETEEEVGIQPDKYEIVACRTVYRYKFPGGHLKKGKYCGQDQTYFLCDYHGKKNAVKLDTHVKEFTKYQWIYPSEFNIKWVPKFKRPVFKRVLKDFFSVKK